jgi:hypothetical protein
VPATRPPLPSTTTTDDIRALAAVTVTPFPGSTVAAASAGVMVSVAGPDEALDPDEPVLPEEPLHAATRRAGDTASPATTPRRVHLLVPVTATIRLPALAPDVRLRSVIST